jgi:PEGA domain
MKKVSGLVSSFLILLSILLSPNCATLTRSRTQRIPVTSFPVGATVIVNGQQQGVTPLEIRLVRKKKGQVIRIESPGYNPVEIRPQRKRSVNPIISNFFMGVIPGAGATALYASARDISDEGIEPYIAWVLSTAAFGGLFTIFDSVGRGKGYELRPTELIVTLTKTDGPPRVDTILVDADELRNIKWIRIHRD